MATKTGAGARSSHRVTRPAVAGLGLGSVMASKSTPRFAVRQQAVSPSRVSQDRDNPSADQIHTFSGRVELPFFPGAGQEWDRCDEHAMTGDSTHAEENSDEIH
ncbi:MAG: hypothetical protein WCP53_06725, partial [Verrucomicrobiota bacterium]